ncbi:MAG: hydantoinase B/oxoprolinase family protein [Acidobacteria bacterium]|nr:hydantoinase B/oxoprolinase family protein [Acidobacteriota bacterium]
MARKCDPVTTEVIRNQVQSIVEEMAIALMKSAYSTNIKERRDLSAAVFDARGRTVVQGEHLPLHLGSMLGLVEHIRNRYPEDRICPGDIFISNDPYRGGGSHLPDVAMAAPVFREGRLVLFVGNIAHHADIGGASPGSMAGNMTEVYQEGLRLPPIKIFERGSLIEDVFELILLNVRVPEERRGDYAAQFASLRLGVRRTLELYEKWGEQTIAAALDEILDATERHVRRSIARLPDGEYLFEDFMDDDGFGNQDIPIRVKIAVQGEEIVFDFTGSAPQVKGNINISWSGLQATVAYALKCLVGPDIPSNEGFYRPVRIVAPHGTIVNCAAPGATAGRAQTCQRVVDVIIGALAPALPERAIGASNGSNTSATFYGRNPANGEYYVYIETYGGGSGGRAFKDGKDGVQVHITNTSNLPIEGLETEYPLFVEDYSLVPDSCGSGKYRGGLGLRRDVRILGHTCDFSSQGDRFRRRPWGIFGGGPGRTGRMILRQGQPDQVELPSKTSGVEIRPGEVIRIQTPGAGGYGPARERDPELVRKDLREGKISPERARADYGVSVD